MQTKNQNSFTAISFTDRTTMAGMFKYVRVKARELYNDAIANKLEITGPVYWIYTGMDGQPDTVFTLDIVIPVTNPSGYNGNFKIKTIEPIEYLSAIHNGSWEKLADTYGQLFMETGKRNYTPTGVCREMYIHMDFNNPENNITEVQVGIK